MDLELYQQQPEKTQIKKAQLGSEYQMPKIQKYLKFEQVIVEIPD